MAEKIVCPHCKEHEMHKVYFEKGKSGLRCMNCDLVLDVNSDTLDHGLQPP
jgi:uncharacterized Zn finger protein